MGNNIHYEQNKSNVMGGEGEELSIRIRSPGERLAETRRLRRSQVCKIPAQGVPRGRDSESKLCGKKALGCSVWSSAS